MAKQVNTVTLKGTLDMDSMTVFEITKDGEFEYDFLKILQKFHDKHIAISIKEENELPTKDISDIED